MTPTATAGMNYLKHFRFPSFTGKRVFYIGAELPDLIAFAATEGADEIIISTEKLPEPTVKPPSADLSIRTFPDWQDALDKTHGDFDLIVINCRILAFNDTESLLQLVKAVMERLALNGICFLDIIVSSKTTDTIKTAPPITKTALFNALKPYAWKNIHCITKVLGNDVDSLNYTVQLCPMKPMAYLLMTQPGSGKSTILRKLFERQRQRVRLIKGDQTYARIQAGKLPERIEVPSALLNLIQQQFHRQKIGKMTDQIFSAGLSGDLVDVWLQIARKSDFVLDSYIPVAHHDDIKQLIEARGYVPVVLQSEITSPLATHTDIQTRLEQFYGVPVHTQPIDGQRNWLNRLRALFRR